MTALPATRQEAMEFVEKASATMNAVQLRMGQLDMLLALARKGAETVGATERWIADEDSATGETYLFERPDKNPKAYPMRRCLILPEDS